MVETILGNPLFVEMILPFLLIFAVVFAILQKTKVLGEGKKQIDAIVAIVIALIVVAFSQAVDVIVYLMPIVAITVVVVLAFMIIYGMAYKEGDFDLPKGVKGVIGALGAIVIVVTILVLTGWWDYLVDFVFYEGDATGIVTNIIFVAVIVAAILIVVWGSGKKKNSGENKE